MNVHVRVSVLPYDSTDTSQNEINEECIRAKDHALLISKKEITSLHVQVQQLVSVIYLP